MIVIYFRVYNSTEKYNRIQKSEISLYKYWVKHSGYFRLVPTVVLGMGITYGKLPLCCGISDKIRENKISMRDYNYRIFMSC